jgi:peptidoglycan/xylan/chitin deacetylase (PgdA/CDA1 family)
VLRSRLTGFHFVLGTTVGLAAVVYAFTTGVVRWGWLAGLCTLAGLAVGLGVSFPQWQMFGTSFCAAGTRRKIVALTFDDGPDPENTPALLALLAEQRACASFFCIGDRVAGQPDLIRQMVAAGHAVENHTFRHDPLTNLFSVARLRQELAEAQDAIQRAAGRAPVFFRPPMGLTNGRVFRVTNELGLTVAGYTARGLDRRADSPERIAGRLLRKLRPGAILLLHDAGVPRDRLLAVVTIVLDRLHAAGYECVRLDTLKAEDEKHP